VRFKKCGFWVVIFFMWNCQLESEFFKIFLSSGFLRGLRWFYTDVSGQPVTIISFKTGWHFLKMGMIGSPETSVFKHFTLRNKAECVRINFNSRGSVRSRKFCFPSECGFEMIATGRYERRVLWEKVGLHRSGLRRGSAGIAGSNSAGGMDVCLLLVLFVVR
jgi:hypothetical protein